MGKFVSVIFLILNIIIILIPATAQEKSKSGKGLVIYKVEMDADEVVQILKANLEAQQITLVDTTNPAAPLSNNVKIFPDFDKLNVTFIQNF
ncbi:MAG: hypothetical protein Q9M89_06675 [Persephonella sp.]|nr:hypothetical protein [Persephonella sp.]